MDLLLLFIIISALIHMWADHHQQNIISIIFKPLTMILIIYTLFENGYQPQGYSSFILLGLIFSLKGDMMLLKPWNKFEMGLG